MKLTKQLAYRDPQREVRRIVTKRGTFLVIFRDGSRREIGRPR